MALPNGNLFLRPILEYFNRVKEAHTLDCREDLIKVLDLQQEDIDDKLANGQTRLDNRICWKVGDFCKGGLLYRSKRGCYRITEDGRNLLANFNGDITTKYLNEHYTAYAQFRSAKKQSESLYEEFEDVDSEKAVDVSEETVEAKLDMNVQQYYKQIEELILNRLFKSVEGMSTVRQGEELEKIAVQLFEKMGYHKVENTRAGGDGGIDGYFSLDVCGLERIAFQCKLFKQDSPVSSKDMDAFSGAIKKLGFQRGVFITTSRFTKECEHQNITQIDGKELAKLMREHEVGCRVDEKINRYDVLKMYD